MTADRERRVLTAQAEAVWNKLRLHTRWQADGFWVAWIFAPDPRVVREFEARMQALLSDSDRRQVVLTPRTPDEARRGLETILADDTREAECVWFEVMRSDRGGGEHTPWADAWDWLMMRANERRGQLNRHLPGGLIFAGVPAFKPRTAPAAPDLWSIRALVLELAPEPVAASLSRVGGDIELRGSRSSLAGVDDEGVDTAPDPELALRQAELMGHLGDAVGQALALGRAGRGLLARAVAEDAQESRRDVLEAALSACMRAAEGLRQPAEEKPSRHGEAFAEVMYEIAVVCWRLGRGAEALAASEQAVALFRKLSEETPVRFSPGLAASLYNRAGYLRGMGLGLEALTASKQAVEVFRTLGEVFPAEFASSLHNLAADLGDTGQTTEALTVCKEAVEIFRRLAKDNPARFLPTLARSLYNLTIDLSNAGETAEAFAASEEAAVLYREFAHASPDEYGQDFLNALNNLAVNQIAHGDEQAARRTRDQADAFRAKHPDLT